MANDPWRSAKPDLSKLPAHIRANLTAPIPLRDNEVYSRIVIFCNKPGLNYPNGRVHVTAYQKDPDTPSSLPSGVQISLNDYTAKIPLVAFILEKKDMLPIFKGFLQAYQQLGGDIEELKTLIPQGNIPPRIVNPMFPEDPHD